MCECVTKPFCFCMLLCSLHLFLFLILSFVGHSVGVCILYYWYYCHVYYCTCVKRSVVVLWIPLLNPSISVAVCLDSPAPQPGSSIILIRFILIRNLLITSNTQRKNTCWFHICTILFSCIYLVLFWKPVYMCLMRNEPQCGDTKTLMDQHGICISLLICLVKIFLWAFSLWDSCV